MFPHRKYQSFYTLLYTFSDVINSVLGMKKYFAKKRKRSGMCAGTASLRPDAPLHHAKGRQVTVFFVLLLSPEGLTAVQISGPA